MKRLLIIAAFVFVILAFFLSGLAEQLTFENLKARQGDLEEFYTARPALTIGLFFVFYVVLAAASIPGAAIATLVAGAIFGVLVGTLIVSFAATIGATLAFLASRFLLRDWVQAQFENRLKTINEGIERDGAFYLFSLRQVPLFPFFIINLLMGITTIRATTFYWVSQVGMLLGTIVYVNAGTQLARLDTPSDIASPGLLLSFAALAAAPWIGKWITVGLRRRRVYAGWTRPARFDRNLVVIGAGAAGLVSAYIAATVKAKVTLVEAGKMGGDCLNYGCVPSKALITSARIAHEMRTADRYGLEAREPRFDFQAVMRRLQHAIATIAPHDSAERYRALGVDVVDGFATLVDPWTVEIACPDGATKRLTTRAIVIATGAEPLVPDLPGLQDSGYLTSETLWEEFARLERLPEKIVVLGGGPIGCELSQALGRLGAKVSQVDMGTRLLAREDADVSEVVREALRQSGVRVLTSHSALRVEGTGPNRRLVVLRDGQERSIPFDALIVAVGRKARLSGYGLERLGIAVDQTIDTDEHLATVYPNIFAAGDAAGPYQFTHTAAHQAWFASVNALFGQFHRFKADYRVIPWTTFTEPEVARVGLNEQQARDNGTPHEVTIYPLDELDRAVTESATSGFVKVLTPPGSDRILGATIVGNHAGELLAEYVLAMKHGLGLNKILGTIHTYPTMAEANKYAAGEWKKKHAPERLLRWAESYHRWRRG